MADHRHISAETWRKLLREEPFDGQDSLVQHLREPCAACEDVLAQLAPSAEDGVVDALLFSDKLGRPSGNDLEFRRITSRIRRRALVVPFAAAALVVIALTAALALRQATGGYSPGGAVGVKGPDAMAEVEVSFAVAWHDGNGVAHLEKGVPGRTYSQDWDLLFRFRNSELGYVAVVREGQGRPGEVIVDASRADPGEHDVEATGRPAGYSLRGVTGHQRFVVVFSSRLLPATDFEAMARKAAQLGPGAAVASFEIQVEP